MSGQLAWSLFGISANTDTADTDGCIWTVASSDGWDAPDQRTTFTSPTAQHGQYAENRFADGRPVVVKGLIKCPTTNAAWLAYDRATSVMPGLTGTGTIISYEPVPKMLTVSQMAPPRVSKPVNGVMTYWLSLIAEYPWKRALTPVAAVTIAAGGSATFTGGGTFPAEIEVTTTSTGTVHLTAGGLTLQTLSVPSGTVLTSGPGFTNPEASVVASGGGDLFNTVVPGYQWPTVVPGSNTFANSGTANLSLVRYLTYA